MRKIQVLFPEPQLERLRDLARREDRPVSEVIRLAVDAWLAKAEPGKARALRPRIPVFHGGDITMPANRMRDTAHGDRAGAHG